MSHLDYSQKLLLEGTETVCANLRIHIKPNTNFPTKEKRFRL